MSSELLKNLLILQLEAVKALVTEYHQQTEAYVQQFGHLPVSQDPADAAHDGRIALRNLTSTSPSLAEGCAVSAVILDATKKHCGADMCATSPDHLEKFLAISKMVVKTAEDRVHALFVLDASLAGKDMRSRFEGNQGYDLLVEWLAVSCSYNDETSKALTELLLLVLQRNVPAGSFTTKTVIKNLTNYKKVMKGKKNKGLLQNVINHYREKINTKMEGYLDHLETTGPVGLHKKIWARRFFKLNQTFHVLEFFTDETQRERKGKMELHGAVVSTADELGGLLSDDKGAVEMSRRFIFRITENGSKKHHYLCANLSGVKAPASPTYKLASSTRDYLEEWLRALRATIAAGEYTFLSAARMSLGELNARIGAFMNHMHLSARISNRVREHGKSNYEITVKAWILERELVMVGEGQDDCGHGSVGSNDVSWQILEYSCAWRVLKSTAELRNFDGQLRLLFGPDMHNIVFPSSSIGNKLQQLHLHASASQKEADNQQRMQVYDVHLQSLLRLPAFSSFGSDATTMLDTFLDISPHLTSFRKLEKGTGQSMHLRDRKVVPWKERERFEVVYKMHLQVIASQEANAHRVQLTQAASPRKKVRENHQHRQNHHRCREERFDTANPEAEQFSPVPVDAYVAPVPTSVPHTASDLRANHQYRHSHHCYREEEESFETVNPESEKFSSVPVETYVAPLPAPVTLNVAAEEARLGESVQERIARIGHRLVIEAFEA